MTEVHASPAAGKTRVDADVDERVEEALEEERRTSYLELFFDLVFVFAITQVTSLVLSDTSAEGFARSLLVLGLIWWAWSAYAWMTNQIDVDSMYTRWSVLTAMVATFFMAFAVPGAYGDDGPWFGAAYLAVAVLQIGLYLHGTRASPELFRSVARLAPFFLVAPTLILVGSLVADPARLVLWLVAVAVNLAGALDAGRSPWAVSPAHFAERHALFVIIALGESIVAIGIGALAGGRGLELAAAALAALAGTAALWWAYFDFMPVAVVRALRGFRGLARGRVARDVFTFLHFPIVAGIVLFAVAAKKAVAHGGDPLDSAGRFALGAGVALVLLAFAAGRYRLLRRVAWERLGAAVGVALAAGLLDQLDATALIAVVVGILAFALAVESRRLRQLRAGARAS